MVSCTENANINLRLNFQVHKVISFRIPTKLKNRYLTREYPIT